MKAKLNWECKSQNEGIFNSADLGLRPGLCQSNFNPKFNIFKILIANNMETPRVLWPFVCLKTFFRVPKGRLNGF